MYNMDKARIVVAGHGGTYLLRFAIVVWTASLAMMHVLARRLHY
jgi:hypothetical protein